MKEVGRERGREGGREGGREKGMEGGRKGGREGESEGRRKGLGGREGRREGRDYRRGKRLFKSVSTFWIRVISELNFHMFLSVFKPFPFCPKGSPSVLVNGTLSCDISSISITRSCIQYTEHIPHATLLLMTSL